MDASDRVARLALAQGVYYLVSGVWPIMSIRSFEAVTGPKADRWLVKTVGALVATTGAVLIGASRKRRITAEIALLAAGNAGALAVVDGLYVAKRRISPVYLLDAVPEVGLVVAWFLLRHELSGRLDLP